MQKNKLIILALFICVFCVPFVALGADSIVTCTSKAPDCTVSDIINTINNFTDILMQIGVVVVAIVIGWAGIQYLTAAGDEGKISGAKDILTTAAVGFFIMLAAYVFVELILSTLGADSWVTDILDNFKN